MNLGLIGRGRGGGGFGAPARHAHVATTGSENQAVYGEASTPVVVQSATVGSAENIENATGWAFIAISPEALATSENDKTRHEHHVDSGCSQHMTPLVDFFTNYRTLDNPIPIFVADGRSIPATGKGDITLPMEIDDNLVWVTLRDVLHVPGLARTLISVDQLIRAHLKVLFEEEGCTISFNGTVTMTASRHNGLYSLNMHRDIFGARILAQSATIDQALLWHCRFGHLGQANVNKLRTRDLVDGIPTGKWEPLEVCEVCARQKSTRLPFPSSHSRTTDLLDLNHIDLIGQMTPSIHGHEYALVLTEDSARHVWGYPLRKKSDCFAILEVWILQAERQTGCKVKRIRTDNGGEFDSDRMRELCAKHGIKHEFTNAYSSQQNGRAERPNRTVMDRTRSMLDEAGLPISYWSEALPTAVHCHEYRIS